MIHSCSVLPSYEITRNARPYGVPPYALWLSGLGDRAARSFIVENRNVRLDPQNRLVYLSAIFDFYTKDFLAQSPSLIAYINRYRGEPVPLDYHVEFFEYDWTINAQTGRARSARP